MNQLNPSLISRLLTSAFSSGAGSENRITECTEVMKPEWLNFTHSTDCFISAHRPKREGMPRNFGDRYIGDISSLYLLRLNEDTLLFSANYRAHLLLPSSFKVAGIVDQDGKKSPTCLREALPVEGIWYSLTHKMDNVLVSPCSFIEHPQELKPPN